MRVPSHLPKPLTFLLVATALLLGLVSSALAGGFTVFPPTGAAQIGSDIQFRAFASDTGMEGRTDVSAQAVWSSQSETIATVAAGGLTTCHQEGWTTLDIAYTDGTGTSLTDNATVVCMNEALPADAELRILPALPEVEVGGAVQLRAFLVGKRGWAMDETGASTWSVSDETIGTACPTNLGTINGVSGGSLKVTAAHFCPRTGLTFSDSVWVEVKNLDPSRSCTCDEAFFVSYTWYGNPGWSDCGQASACHSITGDNIVYNGVPISEPNQCDMTPRCP